MTELVDFLLARIAEDKRIAADAAAADGGQWTVDDLPARLDARDAATHAAHQDPARVLAECAAKRQIVLSCREAAPDTHFLGVRPTGMPDFYLPPQNQHQLAALTLALLALPYADHPEYQEWWRP
ncbi:MAG TPA: DUF6221 family protein [Geodermatophilus sp.]|nr:DUF6221 family protein [Geodermatophilus sp.]